MRLLFQTLLFSIVVAACNKVSIDDPTFSVTTDRQYYKVNDTITFLFSGNPDNIVFFSGKPGSRYENKSRLMAEGGTSILQFSSTVAGGNQANNLSLLASTDYSGKLDTISIRQAKWTDITARAKWATSGTALASGDVDLSDFNMPGKPLFLAFKYVSPVNTASSLARSWNITSVQIKNLFPDQSTGTLAYDVNSAGFTDVNFRGDSLKWALAASYLKFPTGYVGNADEDWAISKPLDLNKVTPDAGTAIKNMSTSINTATYIYKTPGIYKASFVISNASISEQKTLVKAITITINP